MNPEEPKEPRSILRTTLKHPIPSGVIASLLTCLIAIMLYRIWGFNIYVPNPEHPQTTPQPTQLPNLPNSDTTEKSFEQLREALVIVIKKGPQFSGTAYQPNVGEEPVNVRIAWDDHTESAVGEVDFLTSRRNIDVTGTIVYDKDGPGEVVLSLLHGTYDGHSVYNLKAASSGEQLAGTYHFGLSGPVGTLTLKPAPPAQ